MCRNWAQIHERRHVIVHLPSMGLTEGQRQGMFKPQVRENSQMARLCDLADPLVDLLYVAPFKLPEVCLQGLPKSLLILCFFEQVISLLIDLAQ